ncbi:MAG: tetratricopeptide repeat protein [Acidobacteriaceae bacterium]
MTRIFRATLLPLAAAALCAPTLGFAQTAATTPASSSAPASTQPADHAESYYHYGLAKLYEDQAVASGRQDDATQAIEQYKLALDADPNSRILQDGVANLYFRLGRIREAVAAAQDQIAKHPDDLDAHLLLGRVYLRALGDGQAPQSTEMLQAAIKEYETIVQLKPNNLENRLLLGQLYGLNHDSVKAEDEFKAAQKIDPTNEDVVLDIARQYSEQGDLTRASKVIAAVPDSDRTARMDFALAALYDELKRPKDAAAAYQAALQQDPGNTDAERGLAAALTASGQMEAAAKVNAEILQSDPQDAQALIREGEIQRQKGEFEQALTTFKKAEAQISNGNDPELMYNEALVYDGLGQFDDSLKAVKQLLAITATPDGKYAGDARQNRAALLQLLGSVARQAGDTDEAIGAYQQMDSLGGDYAARATDSEVDTYREAHEWAKALQASAAAAKAMPTDHDVQLTYSLQLADAGKLDEAQKLALAQLTGTADDREVYFDLAEMDVRAKKWKDASHAFDQASTLATKPDDKVILYYYRGDAALREKLYDEAELDFRKGLAIDPDNASIENDLGYMYADRGIKLDEAIAMLKKAVDSDPQNYAFLDSLAWAYYKQGQYAMAEDYERKASQRMPNDPTLLDHLGEIEAKNGKLQQAVDDWRKSLQDYASSLGPDADPSDVERVQHKLESARVKLAHLGAAPAK